MTLLKQVGPSWWHRPAGPRAWGCGDTYLAASLQVQHLGIRHGDGGPHLAPGLTAV